MMSLRMLLILMLMFALANASMVRCLECLWQTSTAAAVNADAGDDVVAVC